MVMNDELVAKLVSQNNCFQGHHISITAKCVGVCEMSILVICYYLVEKKRKYVFKHFVHLFDCRFSDKIIAFATNHPQKKIHI